MTDVYIALLSLIITLLIINLIAKYVATKKKKEEVRKANEDLNIEFGSGQGEGIELVKKQYPEMTLRDDPRTGIEETKKPHSIANHMNDPSLMQEVAFKLNEK